MKKFSLMFSLLTIIIVLFCYPSLPEIIPMHWNFAGEIDGYGNKLYILFLSLLPLGMYGLMSLTKKIDPNSKSFDSNNRGYMFIRDVTTGIMGIIVLVSLVAGYNPHIDVTMIVQIVIGMMLMLIGNYMPTIPKNYFLGARTPWALNDENNWKKTQRFSGYSFIVVGLCLLLSGLTRWKILSILAFVLLFVSCFGIYFYSYYLFKKGK